MKKLTVKLHQLDPISFIPVCPQNKLRRAPAQWSSKSPKAFHGRMIHWDNSHRDPFNTELQWCHSSAQTWKTLSPSQDNRGARMTYGRQLCSSPVLWPLPSPPLHSIPWPPYLFAFLRQAELAPAHGLCLQKSSIRNPSTRLLSSPSSVLSSAVIADAFWDPPYNK